MKAFFEKGGQIKDLEALLLCHDTYRAENLAVISSVLVCNVTSEERKRERSGELELDTGSHARARSCDADVTTHAKDFSVLHGRGFEFVSLAM